MCLWQVVRPHMSPSSNFMRYAVPSSATSTGTGEDLSSILCMSLRWYSIQYNMTCFLTRRVHKRKTAQIQSHAGPQLHCPSSIALINSSSSNPPLPVKVFHNARASSAPSLSSGSGRNIRRCANTPSGRSMYDDTIWRARTLGWVRLI